MYYLDRKPGKGKLDLRGEKGRFLGYSEVSKGFRIWSFKKNKVVIGRDVKFSEDFKISAKKINKNAIKSPSRQNKENDRIFIDVEHVSIPQLEEAESNEEDFRGLDKLEENEQNTDTDDNPNTQTGPEPGEVTAEEVSDQKRQAG